MGIRADRYKAMVPQVVGRAAEGPRARRRRGLPGATRSESSSSPARPMTIADTIADRHYGDKVKMAMAFADLLNEEARALEKDGVDVIQFDEPAFNVFMGEVTDGASRRWSAPRGPQVHDRRAHLLRLRHQGQHRLEGDARAASGGSTRDISRAGQEQD
jgi:hypothetical protein